MMPAVTKQWKLASNDPDRAAALARAAGISAVVAQLLLNRGIRDASSAKLFLESPMNSLHSPHLIPGVVEAAERIVETCRQGKKICIYGDYDVDGTTGTSILLGILKLLGSEPTFYVPNRVQEGYGVNQEAIRTLAEEGVQLIVTVDCGITAVKEAEEAKRLGVELIITDHHELKDILPAATVLVHPRLPGSTYPHDGLSGAGVAFKLAWAIAQKWSGAERVNPEFRELLLDNLVLGALGLVADVMPLRDENRAFVRHGLDRLRKKPSIGQKALITVAGLTEAKAIRAEDIGFKLGPRLNAAGRLECARLVVELLTTHNAIRAREIAEYLEDLNSKRQSMERKITTQAKQMIEESSYQDAAGIVVSSAEWHQGVVGIVASRIVDTYARPTLVIAEKGDNEPASGSGRSVPGLPLHEILKSCDAELLSHGGHGAAVGFKVLPDRIPALRELFIKAAGQHFRGVMPTPTLELEAEVPLSSLSFGLLKELDQLEPYGTANPRPKFLAAGLTVDGAPRRMGKEERHLNFRVKQGNTTIRAVAFGMADRLDELMSANGECCLAFTPKVNDWNGAHRIEIEVNDIQAGPSPKLV
jgi:single-stranded-DNA-specific exonuclease